jgi:hypothetical protein
MAVAEPIAGIGTVAVVDDDPTSAAAMSDSVVDAGFVPSLLAVEGFSDLEDMVVKVSDAAQAAVFDHRLSYGAHATFSGAQAIAALYEHRVPGMLVTTFMVDTDVSIRQVRDRVPVLVERKAVDGDVILSGLRRAADELRIGPAPARLARRVLVRIEAISTEDGQIVADAIVPSWDPKDAVRFPICLLPAGLRTDVEALIGQRLIAMVNIGAQARSELFLRDFEAVRDPDPELA